MKELQKYDFNYQDYESLARVWDVSFAPSRTYDIDNPEVANYLIPAVRGDGSVIQNGDDYMVIALIDH